MTAPRMPAPTLSSGAGRAPGSYDDESAAEADPTTPLHTAADILDARRWFVYSHVERGSGWFQDLQAAENLFDSIASGFTTEHVREWAEAMRRADGSCVQE